MAVYSQATFLILRVKYIAIGHTKIHIIILSCLLSVYKWQNKDRTVHGTGLGMDWGWTGIGLGNHSSPAWLETLLALT